MVNGKQGLIQFTAYCSPLTTNYTSEINGLLATTKSYSHPHRLDAIPLPAAKGVVSFCAACRDCFVVDIRQQRKKKMEIDDR